MAAALLEHACAHVWTWQVDKGNRIKEEANKTVSKLKDQLDTAKEEANAAKEERDGCKEDKEHLKEQVRRIRTHLDSLKDELQEHLQLPPAATEADAHLEELEEVEQLLLGVGAMFASAKRASQECLRLLRVRAANVIAAAAACLCACKCNCSSSSLFVRLMARSRARRGDVMRCECGSTALTPRRVQHDCGEGGQDHETGNGEE